MSCFCLDFQFVIGLFEKEVLTSESGDCLPATIDACSDSRFMPIHSHSKAMNIIEYRNCIKHHSFLPTLSRLCTDAFFDTQRGPGWCVRPQADEEKEEKADEKEEKEDWMRATLW